MSLRRDAAGLNSQQSRNQSVDFFLSIVKGQRSADCTFNTKPAQNRLRAVVTRAHRDSFFIQCGSDIFGTNFIDDERQDSGFVASRSDQTQARNS